MNKPSDPFSLRNILAGIVVTVIGGVLVAYIIQEARFAPQPTPSGASPPITQLPGNTYEETPVSSWKLGELLYEETFEDETISGLATKYGTFDIVRTSDGNHVWRTTNDGHSQVILPTTSSDYAVEVKIMQVSGEKGLGSIHIRMQPGSPCFPAYEALIDVNGGGFSLMEQSTSCEHLIAEGLHAYNSHPISLANGVWYTLRMESKAAEVRLYLNDNLVLRDEDIDGNVLRSNAIGFSACCTDLLPHVFDFDDIRVWSIDP